MSFIKSNIVMMCSIIAVFLLIFLIQINPIAASDGIEIKGEISVRGYEREIWQEYIEKLEIQLSGENTGEAAGTVNDNNIFSFKEVNPEDIIQILWIHNESTKSTHVLFPFDQEGKASTLSKGVIRFRFRTMDWVLDEFKKRTSRAAIKGRIDEISEIVTHAKQYHEILSNNKNVDKGTIDRYKHKLLQHICQKSEDQRDTECDQFKKLSNVPIQRKWYVELLKIVGNESYQKSYPAAIIRALNQWVIFSRQAYTKYNRWSDRGMAFSGELDSSFRSEESRELLYKDVLLISTILKNSDSSLLKNDPFEMNAHINMNRVSNWIADINRQVKPLANNPN